MTILRRFKIQEFSLIHADRHLAGTFYFRRSYDVMVQIRTVKPGIRVLEIESPVRAFNARRAQCSPHRRSTSAEMFKAQSQTRPQNPDSRLKTKANHLTPSDLPFPRKVHLKTRQPPRARLGTRRIGNKMIGSRCPNSTLLHVDPRTCMHAVIAVTA